MEEHGYLLKPSQVNKQQSNLVHLHYQRYLRAADHRKSQHLTQWQKLQSSYVFTHTRATAALLSQHWENAGCL